MSPDVLHDPWETETLQPISDAEITIVDAFFEVGQYGTQLVWTMRIDIPHDPISVTFETFNGWYSIGKDWVVQDAGASVTKPTADPTKPPKIHASSNYGKVIDRVKAIGLDMRNRGLPTEARVWKDLRFHMQREQVKYTGLPTTEGGTIDRESSILLPVSHLPALGGAVAAPTVAAPVAAPVPAPAAESPTPISAAAPAAAAPASPSVAPAVAPAPNTAEAHLISVVLGRSSIIEAKQAAVRDQAIAADDALSSRILEHQLIESYFVGDSPVLVMADGRIARAAG